MAEIFSVDIFLFGLRHILINENTCILQSAIRSIRRPFDGPFEDRVAVLVELLSKSATAVILEHGNSVLPAPFTRPNR